MKLTDRQIRLTKPPKSGQITLTDGCGLQLRITSMNRRSWSLQYRHGGAMLKYTIGTYPDISLKDTRIRSTALRANVQAGSDPQNAKRLARLPTSTTVTECFDEYLRDYFLVSEMMALLMGK